MKLLDAMFTVRRWEADRVTVGLHADHPIYRAHFPGSPITPGVCLIQLIGELLEQRQAVSLRLAGVTSLKFAAPISPTDTPVVDCLFTMVVDSGPTVKAKGVVQAGDQTMTKFSLVFNKTVSQ